MSEYRDSESTADAGRRGRLPRTLLGRMLMFGAIGGVVGFGVSLVYSGMGST